MTGLYRLLLAGLYRFRRGQAGAAAVEFALILPVMLVLYVGANEATALITVDRRVQMVAGTLGDLVAREDKTLTVDEVKGYFTAASGLMTPMSTTDLKQYVTQVFMDPVKGPVVSWSKQYINGTYGNTTAANRAKGKSYPLSAAMKDVAPNGSYVIVSEASYPYLPLYGIVISQTIPLYRENYFLPRFGGSISEP